MGVDVAYWSRQKAHDRGSKNPTEGTIFMYNTSAQWNKKMESSNKSGLVAFTLTPQMGGWTLRTVG